MKKRPKPNVSFIPSCICSKCKQTAFWDPWQKKEICPHCLGNPFQKPASGKELKELVRRKRQGK